MADKTKLNLTREDVEKLITEREEIIKNLVGQLNANNGYLQALQELLEQPAPKEPASAD